MSAPARAKPPFGLVVPALAASAVGLIPIAYLIDRSVSRGWTDVVDEIWQQRTLRLVGRSLGLTAAVTVLTVIIGVIAAWLVERSDLRFRRALRVAFALPLAIPSYLAAFAWISWRPGIAGFGGAVMVLTLVSYPYVMVPAMAAMRHLDPALDDVARSLGRSRARVAIGLTLRQIRPAITAGALLVALYILSDFGAVAAMRYEVFTWVIFGAYRAGFNPARAAILAIVLVGLAALLVAAERAARGRASGARIGSGTARDHTPVPLGKAAPLAWLFSAAVLLPALAFPLWRISVWVREYVSTDIALGDLATSLGYTVLLAALAAAATVVLAFPVGVLAARYRSKSTAAIEGSAYIAHALPGIVVAISLVYVGVRVLPSIYLRTPLLVIGYVVLFLPLAVGSVRASVQQSPLRLEEVARSLGSSPLAVLRRITGPLAAPGIGAGAALVALSTMKELPVTLVLHPTGRETLATQLWRFTAVSDYASAGPYAVALVLFAAIPTAILSALSGRGTRQAVEAGGPAHD